MVHSAGAQRPLRRDAERNRQRILTAAAALMAEHGLEVSHDQIARAAKVAVGTVYRRFPDKPTLVDALFRDQVDAAAAAARAALTVTDPWLALSGFMTEVVERQVHSRGLRELAAGSEHGAELAGYARRQIAPAVTELLTRAQRAGLARADATEQDLALIPIMVGAVINAARDIDPELWRRTLAIVLDGLRAADRTPLPGTAPKTTQIADIIGAT